MRKNKLSPRGLEIEFEGGLEEEVTAHGGVGLLAETGRRSGVMEKADRVLAAKKNPKGLGQGADGGVLRAAECSWAGSAWKISSNCGPIWGWK